MVECNELDHDWKVELTSQAYERSIKCSKCGKQTEIFPSAWVMHRIVGLQQIVDELMSVFDHATNVMVGMADKVDTLSRTVNSLQLDFPNEEADEDTSD